MNHNIPFKMQLETRLTFYRIIDYGMWIQCKVLWHTLHSSVQMHRNISVWQRIGIVKPIMEVCILGRHSIWTSMHNCTFRGNICTSSRRQAFFPPDFTYHNLLVKNGRSIESSLHLTEVVFWQHYNIYERSYILAYTLKYLWWSHTCRSLR